MAWFKVTFVDIIEADDENSAYDAMLNYLGDCHADGDVTGFEFKELSIPEMKAEGLI